MFGPVWKFPGESLGQHERQGEVSQLSTRPIGQVAEQPRNINRVTLDQATSTLSMLLNRALLSQATSIFRGTTEQPKLRT